MNNQSSKEKINRDLQGIKNIKNELLEMTVFTKTQKHLIAVMITGAMAYTYTMPEELFEEAVSYFSNI